MLYLLFYVVSVVKFSFFLATVDPQMETLDQVNSEYTAMFGLILPIMSLAVIPIGFILDRYGLVAGLFSSWLLVMLQSILNVIPVLRVQVGNFILFGAFRGFLFAVLNSYCATLFGYRTLGRMLGFAGLLGGCFSLLQAPLLQWAYLANPTSRDALDFFPPNLFLLVLVAASFSFPLWFFFRARRTTAVAPL